MYLYLRSPPRFSAYERLQVICTVDYTDSKSKKQILVYGMSYCVTVFFTKLSLLILYLRIFSPDRNVRYAIYFGIIANAIVYAVSTVLFGAWCIPRHGQPWLESAETSRCRHSVVMDYSQGIFGVISDLYIFILPMPSIMKLNLPHRKRMSLAAIFAMGFL